MLDVGVGGVDEDRADVVGEEVDRKKRIFDRARSMGMDVTL
jgi:hypothetical protein